MAVSKNFYTSDIERLYQTSTEVAAELGINASALRYYDAEFSLHLQRNGHKDRKITKQDKERLRAIVGLLRYVHRDGLKLLLRDADQIIEHGLDGIFLPKLKKLTGKWLDF